MNPNRIIEATGSLKITVILLALLFLLVFLGTLYQVEHGIFGAQERFFFAWIVTAYFIPLPGGQLVL